MNDLTVKSRTAQTYKDLRGAIVQARFMPGEKLRIETLCKALDASSGAVREALSRLTADSLVVAMPQKGFVVAPVSRRGLIDMTEVRIEIETRCLSGAIANGDVDWEARVLSIRHRLAAVTGVQVMVGSVQAAEFHRLHELFHRELVSACPNGWWLRLREQLYVQSERYRRLSGPMDETARDIEGEHEEIATATLARDAGTACAALACHLQRTTKILLGFWPSLLRGCDGWGV